MTITLGLASFFPLGWPKALLICGSLACVRAYFSRLFRTWLGGYTGDCLGAVEQIAEVVILLVCAAAV